MTDLSDLVETLKREVAVPGAFATTFTETADTDLVGSLMDAFAQAQLDGFFGTMTLDVDAEAITPDLSLAGTAVVVTYAAERITTTQIGNMRSRVHYEAGPVKYEVETAATVLTTILKGLQARKLALLQVVLRQGFTFAMSDLYTDHLLGTAGLFLDDFPGRFGGDLMVFYGYELG